MMKCICKTILKIALIKKQDFLKRKWIDILRKWI